MSNPANRDHRTLPARFWSKVDKHAPGGCWLWTASLDGKGYGQFRLDRKTHRAHRLSYIETVGPVAAGMTIDHLCSIRRCVNPRHLESVTQHVNLSRGRSPSHVAHRTGMCTRGLHQMPRPVPGKKNRCRECLREWKRRNYAENANRERARARVSQRRRRLEKRATL